MQPTGLRASQPDPDDRAPLGTAAKPFDLDRSKKTSAGWECDLVELRAGRGDDGTST